MTFLQIYIDWISTFQDIHIQYQYSLLLATKLSPSSHLWLKATHLAFTRGNVCGLCSYDNIFFGRGEPKAVLSFTNVFYLIKGFYCVRQKICSVVERLCICSIGGAVLPHSSDAVMCKTNVFQQLQSCRLCNAQLGNVKQVFLCQSLCCVSRLPVFLTSVAWLPVVFDCCSFALVWISLPAILFLTICMALPLLLGPNSVSTCDTEEFATIRD